MEVQDAFGNKVASSTANIQLTAYTEATCSTPNFDGNLLADVNPKAAVAGVGTFSNVRYTANTTMYLGASSGGLSPACFGPITVSPPLATQLIVVLDGQTYNPGQSTKFK